MPKHRLPYHDATADETVTVLKSSGGTLHYLTVNNNDAGDRYLQLFDAGSACDVTLGTTVPDMHVFIPAGNACGCDGAVAVDLCVRFETGITYAVTTTVGGCTGPCTAMPLSATFS